MNVAPAYCGNLSSLAIQTEIALVERPRRKRDRADTAENIVVD
jgi:hypothetical protein